MNIKDLKVEFRLSSNAKLRVMERGVYGKMNTPALLKMSEFRSKLILVYKWKCEDLSEFEAVRFFSYEEIDEAYEIRNQLSSELSETDSKLYEYVVIEFDLTDKKFKENYSKELEKTWENKNHCPEFFKTTVVKWMAYRDRGKWYTEGESTIPNKYIPENEDLYKMLEKDNTGLKSFSSFYICPYAYSDWTVRGVFPLRMFKPKES